MRTDLVFFPWGPQGTWKRPAGPKSSQGCDICREFAFMIYRGHMVTFNIRPFFTPTPDTMLVVDSIMQQSFLDHQASWFCFYTPRSTEGEWGYTGFTRMSVGPSVCRHGFRNFLKKILAQFISYLAFTLVGWISSPLFIFAFLASFFGPLVAKYSGAFWKKLLAQ